MKLVLLFYFLIFAAVQDIQSGKVSNRLIAIGLMTGLIFQVIEHKVCGIYFFLWNISVPVILLYLLFQMRVLGAGDIKLFSMIGGIWGLQVLCATIAGSFLIAAFLSFCKILYHRNLISRLRVFKGYICQVLVSGRLLTYPQEFSGNRHIIHFSVAILIGYAIAMEVSY